MLVSTNYEIDMVAGLWKRLLKRDDPSASEARAYFDAPYYITTYPDIKTAGVEAYQHFMSTGWLEGRNPARTFNTLYYRDRYLEGAVVNPLSHYLAAGGVSSKIMTVPDDSEFLRLQRQVVGDTFDDFYYQEQVGHVGQDLLTHYLLVGWREGRIPYESFDVARYKKENSYVDALDISPLYHQVSQSRMLGEDLKIKKRDLVPLSDLRTIVGPEFDQYFYAATNTITKNEALSLLDHYLIYGWREGFDPSPLFDSAYYLLQNKDVADQTINPFYHYLTLGRDEGRRPNPVGLQPHRTPAASDLDWGSALKKAAITDADIIVIMPVYDGYHETLAAIHAVLSNKQQTAFALLVVNDSTPNVQLDDMLGTLAASRFFAYRKHAINVGFVATMNAALRDHADRDVVIVNADILVFDDWLDRLVGHARSDDSIATVTPLSNHSSVCSYPRIDYNNIIELERSFSQIDRMSALCNEGRRTDVAVGSAFCMYMSRKSREAVGLFDELSFGYGYSEDADFCLRAAKAGFRNVLAEDILVYHKGAVSFGGLSPTLSKNNDKILSFKHADAWSRIARFREAGQAIEGRMRLDLYRMAMRYAGSCLVFVSQAGAGGVQAHIRHLATRLKEEGLDVVHIRVATTDRWSVEIGPNAPGDPYCPNVKPRSLNQIKQTLADFLSWLQPKAIHVHSLNGFDWMAVTAFMDLVREAPCPYFYTLHDYLPVCHRGSLCPPNSRFCGLPDVAVCRTCVATDLSHPEAIDPLVRRAGYAPFLEGARAVFAPSRDIKARIEGAGGRFSIDFKRHEEAFPDIQPLPPRPSGAGIDVAIVGDFAAQDGARILLSLARDSNARSLPIRYHLIGSSDLDWDLGVTDVTVSGGCSTMAAIGQKLTEINPTCLLMLSLSPEPHCDLFTLATLLRLPPVVFDLGAAYERVVASRFGFVLPYGLTNDVAALNDALRALPCHEAALAPPAEATVHYASIMRDYYGLGEPSQARDGQ